MDLAAVLKPRTRAFSRAARLRASHSYGHVLALVVASFLFAGTAPDGGWTSSALLVAMCATFVTALWTSGLVQLGSRPSVWIAAGAAVVAVLQILVDGDTLAGIVALLTAALAVMTIAVIALGVADQREVNAQSISGAICVYFLLGLLFVFLYGAAA